MNEIRLSSLDVDADVGTSDMTNCARFPSTVGPAHGSHIASGVYHAISGECGEKNGLDLHGDVGGKVVEGIGVVMREQPTHSRRRFAPFIAKRAAVQNSHM